MKVKTLRFKDTKEFVHILENGMVGTCEIPDVLPLTASVDLLKKYYEVSGQKTDNVDFENLEIIEFDFIESGVVGADIRNKLSSPKNLVALLTEYFDNPEVPDFQKLERHIRKEMNQTKVSVEYLAKLL